MKKIFTGLFISLLTFNVFAIEAKVISVSGKVQIQKGSAWVDLKPGDLIKKGDMIQTGFKSEAEIALTSSNENSRIKVAPLSRLTIEQLAENAAGDKTSVYLATGSVSSDIKKTADKRAGYTVRSPVATASVRGTAIDMKMTFDSVQIVTREGSAAAWKTSAQDAGPQIADDADDGSASMPVAGGTANTASISGGQAPKGSFTISEGQNASFTSNSTASAASSAVSNASEVKGGSTITQASAEGVNTTPSQNPVVKKEEITKGKINVNVHFK